MSATNVESVVKDLGRTMTNVDFCIIAATALSYYDFFLTFPEEYSCMWRRRFSGPTVFFFINRYFTLIDLSLMLVNLVSFEALSYDTGSKICNAVMKTSQAVEIILQLNVSAILCLRLYAIWSGSLRILVLVAISALPPIAVRIYLCLQLSQFVPMTPPFIGCVSLDMAHQKNHQILNFYWVFIPIYSLFYNAFILGLTWIKTAGISRTLRRNHIHVSHSIGMYLFRDGTKCFLCLMVLDAATLIGVKSMSGMGVLIVTEALGSILTTRFMLTLRGVYLSNQNSLDSSFHPSKMSNLNITTTTRVVGNLGAPLAYFSEPGPEARTDGRYDAGEDEDEELFYLSRCPLSVE